MICMDIAALHKKALDLRRQRKFEQAFQEIQQQARAGHPELELLLWEHRPVFWSDISAGICKLTRRGPQDAAFMRSVWANQDFIYSFHRHSAALPDADSELQRILNLELTSTLSESRALHWIVRDPQGQPWGLLSLCDISLVHRRAEVLLGILPAAPQGMAAAAMLILFQFYFHVLEFNKLVSLVYSENTLSIESTMHLGFIKEGILRNHSYDPKTARYVDMVQLGLLKADAFGPGNQRLMRRLLTPRNNGAENPRA